VVATLEEAMADPQFILRGLLPAPPPWPDGTVVPRAFVPIAAPFRPEGLTRRR
jgi:hypothetical protein